MAAGDAYVNCTDRALSAEALFRAVIVEGADGKPAVKIYDPSGGGGGGGGSTPTPTVRTPSLLVTSGNAGVPAGAKSVSIANTGGVNATVLGSALKPGQVLNFNAGDYDTLDAISYDGTGTELTISKLV